MENNYENMLSPNKFYKKAEIIAEYGSDYALFLKDTLLLKDEDLFLKYEKDPDVVTVITQNGKISVSKNLLMDLLQNDALYAYLLSNMDNDTGIVVSMSYFNDGETFGKIQIRRSDLFKLLESMRIKDYKIQMRRALVSYVTSLFACLKHYNEVVHETIIDNKLYSLEAPKILEILTMDESDFYAFVNGKKVYSYNGELLSKEIVAFMVIDFIQRERIFSKYILTDEFVKRYKALEKYEYIDFEALDKIKKANDTDIDGKSLLDKFTLDEELRKAIFKGIPKIYSSLEKAIFVYIRLCELLTYDQEFYSTNQQGPELLKHNDIKRLNTINLKHNTVVCWEFIYIYAKNLRELGVTFTLNNALTSGYAGGHISLKARCQEYLFTADAVTSIISGDMSNAKINEPIKGLKCLNKNKATALKFESIFYKVYEDIFAMRQNQERFTDSLKRYEKLHNIYHLKLKARLEIFLKEICRKNLRGIDIITYAKNIFNNLFADDSNVTFTILSSSINSFNNLSFTPIIVITIMGEKYQYLVVDTNRPEQVAKLSKEEIESLFESGSYAYLGTSGKTLPGVELRGGGPYFR